MTKIYKPTYDEATDRLRVMLIEQLVGKLIAEAKIEYPVRGEGRRDGLTSPSMVSAAASGLVGVVFSGHRRVEGARRRFVHDVRRFRLLPRTWGPPATIRGRRQSVGECAEDRRGAVLRRAARARRTTQE